MRAAALLALVAASAACSFPSVDYYDASSTSSDGGCNAPKPCDTQAIQCSNSATQRETSCLKACKPNDTACSDACTSTLTDDLSSCTTACASCADKNGCSEATASCTALVSK